MEPNLRRVSRKLVEYDAMRHRLWILGQRCHHGAGGLLVAGAACLGVAVDRQIAPVLVAMAATGGFLMAHDWKDHAIWFERGYGSQP
jgi:hypothetical protein